MAIKTPYLASEDSVVERRSRGLYRFLVASPIALLIVVALVAHMPRPPYAHPAGDKAYNEKVLSYRERVAAVQGLRPIDEKPTPVLEKEAEAWIDGYRSGRLKPVTSAVYEDHFRDGVRNEIVRTGQNLANTLVQRAELSQDRGKIDDAARQALLGGETAFSLRGFDLQSHLQCLLLFRRATGLLIRIWPRVSENTKHDLRARLSLMQVDPSEVDDLAKIEKTQLADYFRRQKIESLDDVSDRRIGMKLTGTEQPEFSAAQRGARASNLRVGQLLGP